MARYETDGFKEGWGAREGKRPLSIAGNQSSMKLFSLLGEGYPMGYLMTGTHAKAKTKANRKGEARTVPALRISELIEAMHLHDADSIITDRE